MDVTETSGEAVPAQSREPGRLVLAEPREWFPSGFVSSGSGVLASPVCPPTLSSSGVLAPVPCIQGLHPASHGDGDSVL